MSVMGVSIKERHDLAVMHSRPPASTPGWVLDRVGGFAAIGPMPGGTTATMHRVTIRAASGSDYPLWCAAKYSTTFLPGSACARP